jgi:hypothetical protein
LGVEAASIEQAKIGKNKVIKGISCLKRAHPLVRNFVLEQQNSRFITLGYGEELPNSETVKELDFVLVLRGSIQLIC